MSAHFPDFETVRSALMLAVRAPSVHNSQPWRWAVGDHSLHLFADRDRQLRHTDPDSRDLMLSCGATLNHCVIALAALGWAAKVHRFPNPADVDHLASIELRRQEPAEADIALAAAIPRRRTDRRHYSRWPVAKGDLALMGARAARAGVTMRRVDDLANLKQIVSEAAWRHSADYDYSVELSEWSGRYASTRRCPGTQHAGTRIGRYSPVTLVRRTGARPAAEHTSSRGQCRGRRPGHGSGRRPVAIACR